MTGKVSCSKADGPADEDYYGYALICLENNLDVSIAEDLLKLKEDLMVEYCEVILKDEALDDNSSINIYEALKTNGVKFYTI